MASIDKTYLYRWEDYVKLRDWCKSVGTIVDDYGNTLTPLNWLWENDEDNFNEVITRQIKNCEERYQRGECKYLVDEGYITQEEYDNWDVMKHIWGIPVWNTSTELDVWLIRNCPLDFIQERLREQYGRGGRKKHLLRIMTTICMTKLKNTLHHTTHTNAMAWVKTSR